MENQNEESNLELELVGEILFRRKVRELLEQGLSCVEIEQILHTKIDWELFGITFKEIDVDDDESPVAVQHNRGHGDTLIVSPNIVFNVPKDVAYPEELESDIELMTEIYKLSHNTIIHAMKEQNKHVTHEMLKILICGTIFMTCAFVILLILLVKL